MIDEKFNVVFRGQLVKGFESSVVKENLVKLFKSTPEAIEKLFNGNATPIRKNLDYATAMKYQTALKNAGALALIQDVEASNQPDPNVADSNVNSNAETSTAKPTPVSLTPNQPAVFTQPEDSEDEHKEEPAQETVAQKTPVSLTPNQPAVFTQPEGSEESEYEDKDREESTLKIVTQEPVSQDPSVIEFTADKPSLQADEEAIPTEEMQAESNVLTEEEAQVETETLVEYEPQDEADIQNNPQNNPQANELQTDDDNFSLADVGAQILPPKVYQQRDVDTSDMSLADAGEKILPKKEPETHKQPNIDHLSLVDDKE